MIEAKENVDTLSSEFLLHVIPQGGARLASGNGASASRYTRPYDGKPVEGLPCEGGKPWGGA